jgi:mannose-6-phosphate isomerase-like protein (cupin superfamily)
MRFSTTALGLATTLAFAAGIVVSPLARQAIPSAHAESAPLAPAIVDLSAMTYNDLPATAGPEMHGKALVVTDNATIGIQAGNVAKHIHAKTDEIQYIIEGSGAMWLGNERREFKPGSLIIIPRGTKHAGTLVTSGPVKAIAIKIPPQAADDTIFVD